MPLDAAAFVLLGATLLLVLRRARHSHRRLLRRHLLRLHVRRGLAPRLVAASRLPLHRPLLRMVRHRLRHALDLRSFDLRSFHLRSFVRPLDLRPRLCDHGASAFDLLLLHVLPRDLGTRLVVVVASLQIGLLCGAGVAVA